MTVVLTALAAAVLSLLSLAVIRWSRGGASLTGWNSAALAKWDYGGLAWLVGTLLYFAVISASLGVAPVSSQAIGWAIAGGMVGAAVGVVGIAALVNRLRRDDPNWDAPELPHGPER